MGEEYKIVLEKEVYFPGQRVNGVFECNSKTEHKIDGIHLKFQGKANVLWREGRYGNYAADENYFDIKFDLLSTTTVINAGGSKFPFSFILPYLLPPSISHEFGNVKYVIKATIIRPWALDHKIKKLFIIHSYTDLNTLDEAKKPIEIVKTKRPFSFTSERGSIVMSVKLPATGYVPSQMIRFSARVKNASNINVLEVRFKLVQRFEFECKLRTKSVDTLLGQKYAIIDSNIPPRSEKTWMDLELRAPADVYIGNLMLCNLIKSYFELRGELIFPIPHRKLEITIPLLLGNIPLMDRNG